MLLLLAASAVFYASASCVFLLYLLITTLVTYLGARIMDANLARQKAWIKEKGRTISREEKSSYKAKEAGKRRWVLIGVMAVVLGLLGVFKYADFFLANARWLMGVLGCGTAASGLTALNLILPIGLSFYVFQSLGYCIDVYREEIPAERNFLKYALFTSFFPQVLQGPIGNYERLSGQLYAVHEFDAARVVAGLQRVVWGFGKKLIIANRIAACIDPVWADVGSHAGACTWLLVAVMYAFQLYADFSGYMDIACGCSEMLGIKLDENFDCPYLTTSISEFWRKWHITLGVWFKNYLFYPLLRSRWNTKLRKISAPMSTVVALVIVWALIGLWHGADWSYVAYGLYHGFFVILAAVLGTFYEKLHASAPRFFQSRSYAVFQIVRTFLIVSIGYLIFKPANLMKTAAILSSSVTFGFNQAVALVQKDVQSWWICAVWILLLALVDLIHFRLGYGMIRGFVSRCPRAIRLLIYLASVEMVLSFGLLETKFQVFEYFKF
ncbi:MAG: MBOAT family protein [bacterium]|nr:MBOAT family protein [Candidatus Colisoma equi]